MRLAYAWRRNRAPRAVTLLQWVYAHGMGDWPKLVPALLDSMQPKDSAAARLIQSVLGCDVLRDRNYRDEFAEIHAALCETWNDLQANYSAVERALEGLTRTKVDREAYTYVRARFSDFPEVDLASAQENRSNVVRAWRVWHSNNRDYLWLDPDKCKYVVDDDARKAGVPVDRYRKEHPRDE